LQFSTRPLLSVGHKVANGCPPLSAHVAKGATFTGVVAVALLLAGRSVRRITERAKTEYAQRREFGGAKTNLKRQQR
jgi:hypothetical protein